ncbi:MAG: mechanosensitive ion channel family protein [Leptospiraceae bacterium]|nr:mechanosensitive ion channel family protein [Leptospiraceae bacterium]
MSKNQITTFLWAGLILFGALPLVAQEIKGDPLAPVKTDSPRDTMRSFMEAMNAYRQGLEQNDRELQARIDDAVRCLNLDETSVILRKEQGREAAIYLKEVIDRVIVLQYNRIPHTDDLAAQNAPERKNIWRLRKTDIRIGLVEQGERAGEWLFTPGSVYSARDYFEKIKERPYLKNSGMGAGYKAPWLEQHAPAWTRDQFLEVSWWQWIALFALILLGLVLKQIARYLIQLLERLASRSRSNWDDLIIKAVSDPGGYLVACLLWFVSLQLLKLEGTAMSVTSIILKVFFSAVVVWLFYRLTDVINQWLRQMAARTESTLDDQLVPLFTRTLKILVLILGILVTIQNMGINVLSLLAGLGIGGLAFALAAKDTVANFFGSLMILFDKPFQVGDWIRVGSQEGTVEEIGFRSTRIRTFYNSLVSIPNSEVANASIDNMGAREYRRDVLKLGITYDTDPELMELFLEGIKNIIRANPNARKDYFHVVFNGFGNASLEVMVYYFFKVPDWSNELVEKQNVYLEILRLAKKLGVEFAFPTQTVHIDTLPGQPKVRKPTVVKADAMKKTAHSFGPGGALAHPAGQGHFVPPFREGGDVRVGGDDGG